MQSPNGQHWVKTQPQSNGNADNCSTYNVAGVPKYTPRATAALPEPIPSINFPFSSAAVYAKPGDSPKLNNLLCCLDDSELFHLLSDVDIRKYYPHITATRCVKRLPSASEHPTLLSSRNWLQLSISGCAALQPAQRRSMDTLDVVSRRCGKHET